MSAYQGTDVFYNGVLMRNVLTRQWDEEVIYDESGTDVLFTKYRLSFEATVHLQPGDNPAQWLQSPSLTGFLAAQSINPPFVPGTTALSRKSTVAMQYEHVSRLLVQPRGFFQVSMANEPILIVVPGDSMGPNNQTVQYVSGDVDNGPKPQLVSIEHVSGGNLFRIRWGVEAAVSRCSLSYGEVNPSFVLNNRWSVDETMDSSFFITRTISGKIRFSRSTINHQAYKPVFIYPLEQGFRRQSVQYQVDATGLEATYTVVDRQVHTAAPWPATKISGTHAETTGDGVNFYSECNVRLEGPPHADKQIMLERAYHVIDARIKFITEEINKDWMLESAAIVDHIGEENVIEARFRIRQQKESARDYLGNLLRGEFARPLKLPPLGASDAEIDTSTYDPTKSWQPRPWGYHTQRTDPRSAVDFILFHYLQSPCSNAKMVVGHDADAPPLADSEIPFVSEGPPLQTSPGDDPKINPHLAPPDKVNPKARQAMYTYSTMETRYTLAPARVMFPLSQAVNDTDSNADSAVAISFGRGLCTREITIDVERVGELPAIPEPLDRYQDGDLVAHLLDHWIKPYPPTLSPDCRQTVHRVTAHYVYGLNRQPTADEKIALGVMPFTNLESKDTQFALSELYDDQLLPGTRIATSGNV